jgi:hypothetical protein
MSEVHLQVTRILGHAGADPMGSLGPAADRKAATETGREDNESLDISWPPDQGSSGETVLDQRALRFRSLTLAEADECAGSAGGLPQRIRVAKLSGRRRGWHLVGAALFRSRLHHSTLGQDPQLSTFIAYDEGALVSTVSRPTRRRAVADELYRTEIDALRSKGRRSANSPGLQSTRPPPASRCSLSLFHTAYLYSSVIRGFTHAVIRSIPSCRVLWTRAQVRPHRRGTHEQGWTPPPCCYARRSPRSPKGWHGRGQADALARTLALRLRISAGEEVGVLNRLRGLVRRAEGFVLLPNLPRTP